MDWELYDWWFEYLSAACLVAMTKGGVKDKVQKHHFARVRAKSRPKYAVTMNEHDETREKRIMKAENKMLNRDLEEADVPLDIEPRMNRGGLVWEDRGFDAPVTIKAKTLPANTLVNQLTKTIAAPTKPVIERGPVKSDWRLRGCAPMTSKSSPFSRISSF